MIETAASFLLLSQRPLSRTIGLLVLLSICLPSAEAQSYRSSSSRDVVRSVLPDFPAGALGKTSEVTVNMTIGEQEQVTSDSEAIVPKPLFQTTEEEGKWWEDLRMAGREIVTIEKQRDNVLQRVHDQVEKEIDRRMSSLTGEKYRAAISDGVYKTFQPEFDAVHAEFNPKVAAATNRFRALLREGNQKSLLEPLPSHRPIMARTPKPKYTEQARQNKIQGTVVLSAELGADGTVRGIRVVHGLPDGLTEKAIEVAKQLVFLPESKNRKFVSLRATLEFEFNLY
jgi:TonB family protein